MDKNYSEAAFVEFMDYVGNKGLIKPATARSRKIAALKILGALDDHEKIDLRELDRESAFHRFVNKLGSGFTPDSLTTYKSRFNSSLDEFLRYVENRAAFKPGVTQRAARKTKQSNDPLNRATARGKIGNADPGGRQDSQQPADPAKITFPVPIRNGVIVLISGLPSDLSPEEAERIGAVVAALAVPTTKK